MDRHRFGGRINLFIVGCTCRNCAMDQESSDSKGQKHIYECRADDP